MCTVKIKQDGNMAEAMAAIRALPTVKYILASRPQILRVTLSVPAAGEELNTIKKGHGDIQDVIPDKRQAAFRTNNAPRDNAGTEEADADAPTARLSDSFSFRHRRQHGIGVPKNE